MTTSHSFLIATYIGLFLIAFSSTPSVLAYPSPPSSPPLWLAARQTQQPYFPDTPASCPICAQSYPSINSCAQASTAMANVSMVCTDAGDPPLSSPNRAIKSQVLFNPGAFIDVIKCSCTDTFQSAFPQCVDWYVFTVIVRQTHFACSRQAPLLLH